MIKSYIFGAIAGILSVAQVSAGQALWWNNPGCGDIMEIMVNVSHTATTTYYETLGWNNGQNGAGYTGIQTDNNMNPLYIFALWNPTDSTLPIQTVYAHPEGSVSPFGGEGTGLHYLNYNTGWALNTWYRQVVRAWPYKGHTYYGMWTCNLSNNIWVHHVTLDFPDPNMTFCIGPVSFLENWGQTNPNALRHVSLTGGWMRFNGQFVKLNSATVAGDVTACGIETVSSYPTVFMQTGVSTGNQATQFSINFNIPAFTVDTVNPYVTGQNSAIHDNVLTYSWTVDIHQNPPFAFTIQLVDNRNKQVLKTISDTNPDARSVAFSLCNITVPTANLGIEAVIIDIYDAVHTTKLNVE